MISALTRFTSADQMLTVCLQQLYCLQHVAPCWRPCSVLGVVLPVFAIAVNCCQGRPRTCMATFRHLHSLQYPVVLRFGAWALAVLLALADMTALVSTRMDPLAGAAADARYASVQLPLRVTTHQVMTSCMSTDCTDHDMHMWHVTCTANSCWECIVTAGCRGGLRSILHAALRHSGGISSSTSGTSSTAAAATRHVAKSAANFNAPPAPAPSEAAPPAPPAHWLC